MNDISSPHAAPQGAAQANPRIPYRLASRQKPMTGPDGTRLIVNLVVNIEHWPFDRAMPHSSD